MMKRFLTFALSVGFFIWLPSAFADGNGILSLDAPATFRQVQTTHGSPLLTLRVDNIQVRAGWGVEQDSVFTIKAGVSPNEGVLHTVTTVVPGKEYVATIYAVDKFDLLNPNYANLTARAVITVKFESGGLELSDAPRLTAVAGKAVSLHTFAAMGGGEDKTYTLVEGDVAEYFSVGVTSGVLSLSVNAQEGVYVLTVEARDDADGIAEAVATVEVLAALSLADALKLGGAEGVASSLHTFAAQGGIGARTYTLLAGNAEGYFSLGAESGVLSLLVSATLATYTLSVRVRDGDDNMADALAVVDVRALYLASPRPLYAIEGRTVSLHTFVAQGGDDDSAYILVAGDEGYFTLGMNSGALSVLAAPIGIYTLLVRADGVDGSRADATAIVEVRASLSLATVPLLTVIAGGVAHTLAASNGIGTHTYAIVSGDEVGFAVDAASGVLSLSVNAELGRHTLMMQVMDARKNIAETVATVEVSAALALEGAPPFTVIASAAMSLHMFIASGGIGILSYAILAGNEKEGFTLNATSGVLSLQADAEPDNYVLRIQAKDARHNTTEVPATVGVSAVLALADAPLLTAVAEMTMSLHTFAANGGIGVKTYTLAAEGQEYFTLNAASGVLSAVNAAVGVYTLSVTVSDSRGNSAPARGTVEVLAALSLADAPPLQTFARLSVEVSLHTFAASDGLGAKRYALIVNDSGYFALADSGELSLPQNGAMLAGTYTLSVEVSDGLTPPQRATAAAVVQIARNGIFVLGGENSNGKRNDVWSSVNGETWRQETANADWPGRTYHQAVAHNGRLYVLGGLVKNGDRRNDVWSSGDGKNWSFEGEAKWSARAGHQAVEYQGRLYVLGGLADSNKNDVWSSADGKDWSQHVRVGAGWSVRSEHQVVVHNGRLYVLGGFGDKGALKDVWSSVDGNSWTQETAEADWSARYDHRAVSHSGRLYVLGGSDDGDYLNDVWSSVDGRSWTLEKANNDHFWINRDWPQALSRDDLLYVLGGSGSDDVWRSSYGKIWDKVNNAAWPGREIHQAVVFPTPLVLSGTSETITLTLGLSAAEVYTVTAQYGVAPYAYSLAPENIGINIDGDGFLSLDDDQAQIGAYAVTVRVEDKEGSYAETIINIEIGAFALADAPPLFVFAGLAEGMSLHAFTAVYGAGASTYELVGDDSGYFTLGAASGVLSVTANVAEGVYTLSVEVSDERGQVAAAVATVESVSILSLADAPLISVIIGRAVSLHTFTAVGGSGTKTYNLVDAPGFFTLSEAGGILSVQASSEEGIYTVSVEVSDESGQAAAVAIVAVTVPLLLVDAPPLFVFAGLAEGMSLHAFTVVYEVGALTYDLVDDSGYFTLGAASGVLSVTANVSVGVYTLSVGVSDDNGKTAALVVTVAAVPILSLADAPPRSVIVGRAVSLHTFTAVGGSRTKTYNLVDAPGFFALGEASGILSVQAFSEVGVYTVSVRVSDESGQAAAVAIVAVSARLSLADASLMAVEKKAVSLHTFVASGGIGARTYTLLAGNETGYFVLDASGGVLSLSASASPGAYALTVGVEDERGNVATAVAAVNIAASLSLADAPPLVAAEGEARDLHTFAASGGLGVKTYTLVAGAAYFTVDVSSGVLSVDENATVAMYTLSVQAADADGVAVVALATVEVVSLLLFDAPMLYAIVGQEVSLHTFEAGGGSGVKTYTIVAGNEDMYFTLVASSGVLSVQAKALGGIYTLTVAVNDEDGNRAEARAVVAVADLFLADMPLLTAFTEITMSLHTFAAIGGIGTNTYTLAASEGQEYFILNATSGVLSVANAAAGVYTLSVTVSDSIGNSAQARGTVEVLEVLSLADASYLEALARLSVEVSLTTFAAGGGIGNKRYTLIADKFDYFAIDAVSGELSLPSNSAMLAGVYTLRVEVSDSTMPPQRATAAAVVQIARNGIFVLGGNANNGLKNDAWRSTNGKAWTRETANAGWPGRRDHQAVVHNGRMYVLGGNDGSLKNDVWSSADGKNWSFEGNAAWTAREQHQAVSYKGRIYVLGGVDDDSKRNDVWSWADGEESWKEETGSAAWTVRQGHQAVVHNGRMYVLGGNAREKNAMGNNVNVRKKDVWSSADGANWRFEGNAQWRIRERHQAVSHQGRLYILGGSRGTPDLSDVWSSLNGKSWRREKADDSSSWIQRNGHGALSRDGLLYVLGGRSGPYLKDVWSSADGKIWTKGVDAAWRIRDRFQAVVFPPNLVLSGTSETIILPLQAEAVVRHTVSAQYGVGKYTYSLMPENEGINIDVAGVLSADNQAQAGVYKITVRVEDEEGSHAETILNVDLQVFALADAPPLAALARLSVAVTLHAFATSDGIGSKRYRLIAGQSSYFALDADSGVLSLPSNSAMLAGTYTLMVEASDSLTPPQRATAAATVQITRNRIFVTGGRSGGIRNDVWSSADGEIWRRDKANNNVGWSPRQLHQAVAHNGRMYVMGGADGNKINDVWWSVDGANWQREADAAWTGREIYQAVSYKGQIYVLGGYARENNANVHKNDVWSSADGVTWDEETGSAGWTARDRHQAVVHNGRMYVLGGQVVSGGGGRNDVWSSADGANWSFEGNADWDARYFHQAVSHAGRLYVLGGSDGSVKSDVWSSVDGRSWVEEKADTGVSDTGFSWSQRYRHQSLSRDGLLYVLGGQDSSGSKKDVWSSADGRSWTKRTDAAWTARLFHQAVVFPPNLVLSGTSETITLTMGVGAELHTFSAQYGVGQYTYSLALESESMGFDINESSGVLSAESDAEVGGYTLTVQVEDEEGSRAETVVQVEIIAASAAALSAGSSIISPSALGGGASALALAGGGLSLLIITPPASSLARPRTPPTSAGGENIGWRDLAPPQARG